MGAATPASQSWDQASGTPPAPASQGTASSTGTEMEETPLG